MTDRRTLSFDDQQLREEVLHVLEQQIERLQHASTRGELEHELADLARWPADVVRRLRGTDSRMLSDVQAILAPAVERLERCRRSSVRP